MRLRRRDELQLPPRSIRASVPTERVCNCNSHVVAARRDRRLHDLACDSAEKAEILLACVQRGEL
jgi:hypothetical protein